MKKFKTIIVEDNDGERIGLLRELKKYPNSIIDSNNITQASSFNEARELLLNGNKYNLAILDMHLGNGKSCFDLLKIANDSFKLIAFATVDPDGQKYFEHIKPHADYLTIKKPFTEDNVADFIFELQSQNLQKGVQQNLINVGNTQEGKVIKESQIIYIEIDDNLLSCFYHDDKHNSVELVRFIQTLKAFTSKLNMDNFIFVGRDKLINLFCIDTYNTTSLILKTILFKNNIGYKSSIELSSTDYKLFRKKMGIE